MTLTKSFVVAFVLTVAGFSTTSAHAEVQESQNQKTTLTISTFNIAWYGLGGTMTGSSKGEHRTPALKKFISNQLGKSDVISFQEIVDVEGVKQNLLPSGWSCESYEHDDAKHQHVVLCIRPGLQFQSEPSDDNNLIDEVALRDGRSRPALHLIVANSSGKAITRLIGVHLKAFPNYAGTRYSQAKHIGLYLQKVADPSMPVVILGDFNTYPAKLNGKDADDSVNIESVLGTYQGGMKEVKGPFTSSYRTKKHSSHFDRIYRSANVSVVGEASAFNVCGSSDVKEVALYNETISDHCPVSATLQFAR